LISHVFLSIMLFLLTWNDVSIEPLQIGLVTW